MISLNEVGGRFRAIWDIIQGDSSKLHRLDISPSGFKTSFQAIIVALAPLLLRWLAVMQAAAYMPDGFSRSGIFLRAAFIDLCQWIIPLMIIIAASGILGIGDRLIAFVITYNWGKAFIEWLYAPFIALQIILPEAYALHWLASYFMLAVSIGILYRLFQTALDKKTGYILPFTILYGMISVLVLVISLQFAGWFPPEAKTVF